MFEAPGPEGTALANRFLSPRLMAPGIGSSVRYAATSALSRIDPKADNPTVDAPAWR